MNAYCPAVEARKQALYRSLSEKDRRRYAALEAKRLGHGGVEYFTKLFGGDCDTIRQGRADIERLPHDPAEGRIRKKGAVEGKLAARNRVSSKQLKKKLNRKRQDRPSKTVRSELIWDQGPLPKGLLLADSVLPRESAVKTPAWRSRTACTTQWPTKVHPGFSWVHPNCGIFLGISVVSEGCGLPDQKCWRRAMLAASQRHHSAHSDRDIPSRARVPAELASVSRGNFNVMDEGTAGKSFGHHRGCLRKSTILGFPATNPDGLNFNAPFRPAL
ncbi:hypothetical protein [Roseimaritima sediminicola]|uniref:hypothetical protein n=1 Tax=Roseimaritima sediminicola TaxID=2662066 RepID=UPI00192A5057|nr:hypothetical protein [Roseimaritima sediminicola]